MSYSSSYILGEAQWNLDFQQQYNKLKQDLMEMGYDLKQIDDAVISTQSANRDDILDTLASSGILMVYCNYLKRILYNFLKYF